jgi:hypothetical protein
MKSILTTNGISESESLDVHRYAFEGLTGAFISSVKQGFFSSLLAMQPCVSPSLLHGFLNKQLFRVAVVTPWPNLQPAGLRTTLRLAPTFGLPGTGGPTRILSSHQQTDYFYIVKI